MNDRTPRVLLVDDDIELCELVSELLRGHGFDVHAVHDGRSGVERASSGEHDIVVLDVMLPQLDGLEVLQRLRHTSRLPVLMLTARGGDEDRIAGLDRGADDYLAKPFHPGELVARIRAILRRTAPPPTPEPVRRGPLEARPASRELRCHGTVVHCTDAEFDILEQLLRSPGRAVSREALVEGALGRRFDPRDRSLDVHISNLRKRLGEAGLDPVPIVTVRGEGYLFAVPPEPA